MCQLSHLARHRSVRVLAAFLLALLVGCSAVAEFVGLRIRLDKIPVTAVSASLVDKRGAPVVALAPGQSARLVLVATAQDGKQYPSVGAGYGRVALNNYSIAATIVTVSKPGTVSLSPDPRVSEGKLAHLRIVPVAHPEVSADLDIPVRYDIAFSVNFSGADGMSGMDGTNGIDGMRGTDGAPPTTDPVTGLITQGAGGNGGNGGDGSDGSNGRDGAPGQSVHLWVRMESGTKLLQVKVVGAARQSHYLVDPNGGSLKITADGGRGGRGGQGGRGGRGGSGGSGFPPGSSGFDGHPGSDGRSGFGGAAGTIAISVDPAAQQFLKCITWSNHNGDGVPGPAPTVTVEPVAPLW